MSNKAPKSSASRSPKAATAPKGSKSTKTQLKAKALAAIAEPHTTDTPSLSRASDPHLERESEKYDTPLPSRERILEALTQAGVPVDLPTLMARLEITEDEREHLERRLRAMERDAQILRNRSGDIGLTEKMDLIAGRVQGHPDGFGFLIPDDNSDDLFLGPKQMQRVLDGDRVLVREVGVDRRGRREATIVEILEHKNTRVVGRLFIERGILFVVAENKRINQDILVEPGFDKGATSGQVVMVELVAQPTRNSEPVARVIEVLGNYADPGMEIEIALRKHDLPHEWSSEITALEKKIPKKVTAKEIAGRKDLRALPFVTIDGETAKDFDDAVYAEKQGKGFKLFVAIADVSHYVTQGDAFDRDARLRGTSVYFPRRVIPMLPEALSNEMCSLKPEVDRLALVCEMQISAAGEIKRYDFYEAVFHSAARLTYTTVARFLYEMEPDHGIAPALLPHLKCLDDVFQVLLAARHKRGAIDFETTETEMRFTEDGKIREIVAATRNDAHRLIEECMLAANVCAAEFLSDNEHPALYRIHDAPSEEKLNALRSMLKDFGIQLGGGVEPKPRDFTEALAKIKGRPDAPLLQTVMLRSMKQAVYSPENIGHFGLAFEAYTHFTSPIRRYPDLLTHRAIKAALKGETYDPKMSWDALGEHCSMTERRADEASRDVVSWLKCYYMKDRLGETFAGTISSVTGFGLFVTLDDVFVEGLVHISELGQDYFKFDQARHLIIGERTRQKFQLADRVNVKVARVDIETAKIDFVLAGARLKKGAEESTAEKLAAPPWNPQATATSPKVAAILKEPKFAKPSPADAAPAETTSVKPEPAKKKASEPDKTIITVSSANPPTTPMAGFAPHGDVPLKKSAPPKPNAAKPRSAGALLTPKTKQK